MKISIVSGKVQSGKTSYLLRTLHERENCRGILSPLIKGKREFLNLTTAESRAMEADENESDILTVGRYKFSVAAFKWAEEILRYSISTNPDELIIDEIGPLELQGKGFAKVLHEILHQQPDLELILVMREQIIDEVLDYFKIDKEIVHFINPDSDII